MVFIETHKMMLYQHVRNLALNENVDILLCLNFVNIEYKMPVKHFRIN